MPVSNISVVGERSSTRGASWWIAAPLDARRKLLAEVDRFAEQVEDPAQRGLADREP